MSDPYLDDQGDFFALTGKHRKLEVLRQWRYHCGMDLFDMCEGREVWPNIRVTKAFIIDSDDPSTWDDETRDSLDGDDYWPYEWDLFMKVDPAGPHTVTAYMSVWPEEYS